MENKIEETMERVRNFYNSFRKEMENAKTTRKVMEVVNKFDLDVYPKVKTDLRYKINIILDDGILGKSNAGIKYIDLTKRDNIENQLRSIERYGIRKMFIDSLYESYPPEKEDLFKDNLCFEVPCDHYIIAPTNDKYATTFTIPNEKIKRAYLANKVNFREQLKKCTK